MFPRALVALFFSWLLVPLAQADSVEFNLRDLNNHTVTHADFADKVVVMSFWATWCGPCKEEMPHLEKMYKELQDQGLVVLSVNTDDARRLAEVKSYIKRQGFTFPVVKDSQSKLLASQNPSKTLPFTVILSRDGRVAHRLAGFEPGDETKVHELVVGLLGGEPDSSLESPEAEAEAEETDPASGEVQEEAESSETPDQE